MGKKERDRQFLVERGKGLNMYFPGRQNQQAAARGLIDSASQWNPSATIPDRVEQHRDDVVSGHEWLQSQLACPWAYCASGSRALLENCRVGWSISPRAVNGIEYAKALSTSRLPAVGSQAYSPSMCHTTRSFMCSCCRRSFQNMEC